MQLRADNDRLGASLGLPVLLALCEKGADTVLIPVSARKQLFDLSDDMATRVNVQFYSDTPDALLKALLE